MMIHLFLSEILAGWDEKLCQLVPTICITLRGTLRTESGPAHDWYQTGLLPGGDEAVILFRVAVSAAALSGHSQ